MKRERGVSVVFAEVILIFIGILIAITILLFVYTHMITTPYSKDNLIGSLVLEDVSSDRLNITFRVTISNPSRCSQDLVKIMVSYDGNLYNLNRTLDKYTYVHPLLKFRLEAYVVDNDADGYFSSGDSILIRILDEDSIDNYRPTGFKDGDYVVLSIKGFNGSLKGLVPS